MNFAQFRETAPLRRVIIGRYRGYRAVEAYVERVNEDQKKGLPTEEELAHEFEQFCSVLESRGVEVLIPDYVGKFVYDQLTPRDIGVTIGHRFVLCNMARASRRYEAAGIFSYLRKMGGRGEPDILLPPAGALLEGGDILVDRGRILVGISQRTNEAGYHFLKQTFEPEFDVIPIHCRSLSEGENVLHLDCTFNPVGREHALIYPGGFREIPAFIREDYRWIEINAEEQAALATNVLSIDESTLISRDHPVCRRVNDSLRKKGLEVLAIPFNGAPSTGGSFRCCSLPLLRE